MGKCIFIALPVCVCHEISANETAAFGKQTLKAEKKPKGTSATMQFLIYTE